MSNVDYSEYPEISSPIKIRGYIDEIGNFTRLLYDGMMLDDIIYDYGTRGVRCHSGQRKLFYSELEYITKIYEIDGNKLFTDMLIVYVGAAEGHHTNVLIEMFPDLHYLLYDPRKFVVTESDNVKIMTGDMGMFTLNSIHFVKEYAKGKEIVFICDMRLFVTEEQIWTEMEYQRDWGILLNAKYMLLKYRLPYVTNETLARDYTSYNQDLIGDKVIIDESTRCDFPVIYLDGEILSQIYAPIKSTEARLFVKRRDDGKYNMRYYDFYKHENVCYYFNTVYRHLRFKYKDSDDMQNHLLGYDDGYESVCEYYLVDRMLSAFNKPSSHIDIMIALNNINNLLIKSTNGNNIISDMFKSFDPGSTEKSFTKISSLNIIRQYLIIINYVVNNINNQIETIKKSNIFDESQITYQLNMYSIKRGVLYELINGKYIMNMKVLDSIRVAAKNIHDEVFKIINQ